MDDINIDYKWILVLIIFFAVNSHFSVEEKKISGFPTFAIYSNKIPIYATLSGGFTTQPEKELSKTQTFFKSRQLTEKIGTGSSYLTIKCENKIYKFHELQSIKSEWNLEESSIQITGEIPNENVKVFVILKNKRNRDGSFFVSYGAINQSNRIVDIGFRTLVDVGTEANDGIPLKISPDNISEKEIYSNEFKFTPYKSNYWETYESESEPMIGLRNHMTGQDNTPPDQVAFVNWEKAFLSDWNYFTNKHIFTHSDSAVLIWWNPRPVKSGETLLVSTEYEIKKKREAVSFDFLDSETGSGRLYLTAVNNSDSRKEIAYHISASENVVLSLNSGNPLSFIMEPNSTLDRIIPIILHGKGEVNLIVKEKYREVETNYNLPVQLANESRDQSPKFWKSSRYPIIYNSDKDGMKLKGVVRAKDTGKKLGETALISVKSIQNSFVYLGEVDLKDFNGEVLVEIFKQ